MSDQAPVIAHPAATVVLLREGAEGCEALLVRRNPQLVFHGGAWVFPGGRIDPEDYAAAGDTADVVGAAMHAAVREAFEEAGMTIARADLRLHSRWVTPEQAPKRFDAWYFLARAGSEPVRVDGGEIHAHCWMRPGDALAARDRGELELPPPTFVTLSQLTKYRTATDALGAAAPGPFDAFLPRVHVVPEGACCVYAGDVAYEGGDVTRPGPRHRLWMLESGWRYERRPMHEQERANEPR